MSDHEIDGDSISLNTRLCQECGTPNDIGRSVCINCGRPLTAYGSQLGQPENYQGKLNAQVAALETRPLAVTALTGFYGLMVLIGPLWAIVSAFSARPHLNVEGTNATAAAVGTIGPILSVLTMLPLAVGLGIMAWATWTQRTWAWTGGLIVLGLFGVVTILHNGLLTVPTVFWLVVAGVLTALWIQKPVKAWYGL